MLDGIWRVFNNKGKYIGRMQTAIGNDCLMVSKEFAKRIKRETILNIDEVYTDRAWIIKVVASPYPHGSSIFCHSSAPVQELPNIKFLAGGHKNCVLWYP